MPPISRDFHTYARRPAPSEPAPDWSQAVALLTIAAVIVGAVVAKYALAGWLP
jgi:hypothetical protein